MSLRHCETITWLLHLIEVLGTCKLRCSIYGSRSPMMDLLLHASSKPDFGHKYGLACDVCHPIQMCHNTIQIKKIRKGWQGCRPTKEGSLALYALNLCIECTTYWKPSWMCVFGQYATLNWFIQHIHILLISPLMYNWPEGLVQYLTHSTTAATQPLHDWPDGQHCQERKPE